VNETTLEGCWEKTRRAEQLGRLLNQEWSKALTPESYPVGVEEDGEPGCHRVWVEAKKSPPLILSVIIGEIAHNLRSALDHLIYRQAVEHVGCTAANKNARLITFPICRDPTFLGEAQALNFVCKDTGALVAKYQPYERGNGYLAMLHWFNKIDKHRTVHPTATLAASSDFLRILKWNPASELLDEEAFIKGGDRLEGRADVVRLRFAVPGPDPEVQVTAKAPLLVGFGEIPKALQGIGLPSAVRETQAVIGAFRDLLAQR